MSQDRIQLKWQDDFSVEVQEIDDQHKKIIGFINSIDDNLGRAGIAQILKNILREMTDYAQDHFGTEEKYFDLFGYEDSVEHKKGHDTYENKVGEFEKQLAMLDSGNDNDCASFTLDLMGFLEDWWVGHILHSDKQYMSCFKEHGLK